MTVAELIVMLQGMPQDVTVFVDGYEGGIITPKTPRLVRAKLADLKYGNGNLFGTHDEDPRGDVVGVLIERP